MKHRLARPRGLGLFVPADVAEIMRQSMYTYGDPPGVVAPMPPGTLSPAEELAREAEELARYFGATPEQIGGDLPPGPGAPSGDAGYTPSRPPWLDPPPGSQPFMKPGVIATPAADGADHVILELPTPDGYYGVINRLSHNYTGPGFVQGSGDLTFRLMRDFQGVKNFEAILVEFGTPQQRLPIDPIAMVPGQTFRYLVNVSTTAVIPVAGTFIIAFLGGYFYPQQFGGAG